MFPRLEAANQDFERRYPGESPDRQPVHTVYGGAHLFRADTALKLRELALQFVEEYAPTPADLAAAVGGEDGALWATVHERVRAKLEREAVEDFRLDFEDGYGHRPDDEEDECAVSAATEVAKGLELGSLPPFLGIRVKPFSRELHRRSVRTIGRFLLTLLEKTGNRLPDHFVITLPKVVVTEQIEAFVESLAQVEERAGLEEGTLRMELMIETPQSILDPSGRVPLLEFVDACGGRCVAAHFGVYDYTAGCSITALHQHLRHPACDHARAVIQVALAGTGVWLSDGATNVMPAPPHRGESLTEDEASTNRSVVHAAWRLHFEDIRHSLENGYYQGWDLHPGQLPTRFAAVFAFFLEGLPSASERLKNFVEMAAQATLVGDVFDDAATGQGLLNFFLRGVNCGAITEAEALATGLTLAELRSRSFLRILEGRRS